MKRKKLVQRKQLIRSDAEILDTFEVPSLPPVVDTVAIAEDTLRRAATGDEKLSGIRIGQLGVAEINFKRSLKILQLAESVEKRLIEKIVDSEEDYSSDHLLSIYRTLLVANEGAVRQIESVVGQDDNRKLLSALLKGDATPDDNTVVDITDEAVAALKLLN